MGVINITHWNGIDVLTNEAVANTYSFSLDRTRLYIYVYWYFGFQGTCVYRSILCIKLNKIKR